MSTLNVNNINEAGGVEAVITGGVLDSGSLPAGSILQVVSTTKTDTFSTTSGTPVTITGATVTITPSSTSSKVFITATSSISTSTDDSKGIQLYRGATLIGGGTPAGSRSSLSVGVKTAVSTGHYPFSVSFLDSPNTTSSTTYSLSTFSDSAGRVTYPRTRTQDGEYL